MKSTGNSKGTIEDDGEEEEVRPRRLPVAIDNVGYTFTILCVPDTVFFLFQFLYSSSILMILLLPPHGKGTTIHC